MTSLNQTIKSFLNHCQYEKNLSGKTLNLIAKTGSFHVIKKYRQATIMEM
jgi:hypothetical protein